MKLKIDEFVAKGFNNIVLSGISAGAWTSLVLKSDFPDLIDGVVGFAPARSGKVCKKIRIRDGLIGEIIKCH